MAELAVKTDRALSPLQQTARRLPHVEALRSNQLCLSYRDLAARALAIAGELKARGIRRLAVIGPNSAAQVLLYWGCIEAGVLFCPLSWRFPAAQLEELANRLGIDAVFVGEEAEIGDDANKPLLPSLPRFCPSDAVQATGIPASELDWHAPVNLVLTSGSSGAPKAALHSLNNHIASAEGAASLIPLVPGDGWLLSLPLFHIGGIAILNRCAHGGAAVVLAEGSVADSLAQLKPTHVSLVAAQLATLLETPQLLAPVKALLLGGGAMPSAMQERLLALGIKAFCSYGLTEMSSQVTSGAANSEGHSGSLLPGRELKIEDGQILLRGDSLFLGYLTPNGVERPLTPDGWFASKDRGSWIDDDGALKLKVEGRLDNMFICGGENLQPEEVEAALCQHPDIVEAIVFPAPDPRFGALPHAIIKAAAVMPSPDALDAFLQTRIARFKRPRSYLPWPEVAAVGLKVPRKQVIAAALAASHQSRK
ncbi:AMP-binding protein [Shewanella sp. JM162201]|uniref:AMP-binding protein n=1 Tax=Shewanella jiangmenensis TaxID=2837387 RepID=A0ABS5V435_9GAMM|nr:AMP-binding protein [Shewanella jiangmenensis]MBT1445222.1 AMP-binding protein [Shewanella jiangmenensis]